MRAALATATLLVALTVATAIPTTAASPLPAKPLAPHLLDTLAVSPGFPAMQSVPDYLAEQERIAAEKAARKRLSEARRAAVSNATVQTAQTTRKPSRGALTEAQVRSLLEAAQAKYGVDDWIISAGLKVAWGESRYNPDARNGQYVGIMQFGSSWGSEAKRLDPTWSIDRFVRVYAEGGKAKIRQHWRATI